MRKIVGALTLSIFALAISIFNSSLNVAVAQTTNGNLIVNSSLEQNFKSGKTLLPSNWIKAGFGNNTAKYEYPVVGFNGQKAAKITVSKYSNGDRKWSFKEISVKPNTQYVFSNYFKSNVETEINVKFVLNNKKEKYVSLIKLPTTQNEWHRSQTSFITPANVKSLTVFQLINKKGELIMMNGFFGNAGVFFGNFLAEARVTI